MVPLSSYPYYPLRMRGCHTGTLPWAPNTLWPFGCMMAHGGAYGDNHAFAVAFTCVAAASQGLGGLLAVLGMGEFGSSVAHLMSFSTGVMIYLSFMDIMVETKEKIGEEWAGVAFFAGIGLFLLLEVCLPEVDGSQVATAWAEAAAVSGGGQGGQTLTDR
jgi:hypothetical protein